MKSYRYSNPLFQNLPNTEKISYSTPATPTQVSDQFQQEFLEQLKQQKDRMMKEPEDKSGRRSHQGSIKSPTPSIAELKEEKAANQQSASHAYSAAYPQYRATNQLKADLSFEEDTTSAISQTSSTSGIYCYKLD